MLKTTVKMALGAVFLVPGLAFAHYTPCEDHLLRARIYENLVDEAADFELELNALESVCRGGRCLRDAQNLRAEFVMYVENLLEQNRPASEMLEGFAKLTTRAQLLEVQALPPKTVAGAAPPVRPSTVLDFESRPEALRADEPITTGNDSSYIRTVIFATDMLGEFWRLQAQLQVKFLRAIYLGIVGPVGESGIKLLTDIAKNLVEVKTYGGTRLFGCLERGNLRILRVSTNPNHTPASLVKYRTLCD
jgi:hypothetical protein